MAGMIRLYIRFNVKELLEKQMSVSTAARLNACRVLFKFQAFKFIMGKKCRSLSLTHGGQLPAVAKEKKKKNVARLSDAHNKPQNLPH